MLGDAGLGMRDLCVDDDATASIWNKPKGEELVCVLFIKKACHCYLINSNCLNIESRY